MDYYGVPKSAALEAQLIKVVPPFKMYYEGKQISSITFHRKAAAALTAALNEIWDKCGHDQKKIDDLRLSVYDGTYNPRKIAGSDRWSNHAFGAAIDIDAAHNGFNTGHGTMPQVAIDAFKRVGFRWGGDYKGRTDPMHFEACGGGTFNTEAVTPPSPTPTPEPTPTPLPPTPELPVLQIGAKGTDVEFAQHLLFVDGIFGKQTEQAVKDFQEAEGLVVDGIIGPNTWKALINKRPEPDPIPTEPIDTTGWQTNITATVFGGSSDVNKSAYTGKILNDADLYLSLPATFTGDRPLIRVRNVSNGKTEIAPIEDKGPWNVDDPYWEKGTRPQAETGTDKRGRKTNLAGIDLSPELARRLGISGKGKVDWQFYNPSETNKGA